jgi:hypothetical protein
MMFFSREKSSQRMNSFHSLRVEENRRLSSKSEAGGVA